MRKKAFLNIIIFFVFTLNAAHLYPQQPERVIEVTERLEECAEPDSSTIPKKKKYSFWQSLIRGNIDRSFEQAIDLSIAVAPYYNQEASFGLGLMGSGLYRLDRRDSTMPPSNITIAGNVSLNGFYGIYLFGNNYFKGNRSRISYDIYFNNKVLNLWGTSFDDCAVNPVINYTRRRIKIYADYAYKVSNNFRVGGIVDFAYDYITRIADTSYLQGEGMSYLATGLGASVQYDSRDFIPNPKRGIYLALKGTVYPKAFGSCGQTLYRVEFTTDYFQKLWNSGRLCFDLYGRFNSKDTPWSLKEELGGPARMRGYYTGRYIDNNIITVQAELRQHLFKRFGCVVWGGAGTVFPTFDRFEWENILPSYGLGLRWEFKHKMNLRIDYGFGKQSGSFMLSIGEAF